MRLHLVPLKNGFWQIRFGPNVLTRARSRRQARKAKQLIVRWAKERKSLATSQPNL